MNEFWLGLALSDENTKCVSASYYLKMATEIKIDAGEYQTFSGSHSFLMHKMLNTLILKERLFNIIKDNGLYSDYLLYHRNNSQWFDDRYSNDRSIKKIFNSHLRIVR